jgi:FtsZ-binding cell division protein ZapB
MKSLYSYLKFRQKEINLLLNEIKSSHDKIDLLKNEIMSQQNKNNLLRNSKKSLKEEIDKLRNENQMLNKKNVNELLQQEIESLRKENKSLKDTVKPLQSLPIPLSHLVTILKQFQKNLQSEIENNPKAEFEKMLKAASYHDSGKTSSSSCIG